MVHYNDHDECEQCSLSIFNVDCVYDHNAVMYHN